MTKKISFHAVFIRNEFHALKGRFNSTIVYLSVILFITFLTFGFAKSMLRYQEELSSEPFSNWINLNFHSGTRDSLRSLDEKIESEPFRKRFHIRGSYFYNKGMVSVLTFSRGNLTRQYEARTIDPRSGIVNDLLTSDGCIKYFPDSVENAFDFEPNGVIISAKLLKDIGMKPEAMSFIRIRSPQGDFVPIPVLAVVKELPDLADVIYTNLFYCKSLNTGFYDRENAYSRLFVDNIDTAGILNVLHELTRVLAIKDPSTIQTTLLKTGNTSCLTWKIEIGRQQKELPTAILQHKLDSMTTLKDLHAGQYFELSDDTTCDNSSFFHDYLAIEFTNLEKIRDFSGYLKNDLALELNLEDLADRENYLYTGNIAVGSIILLMLLSLAAVSMYLSGIIRNHLLKIRKNLGNFMAFGVQNKTLIRLYILVMLRILATATLPACLLSYACGELFEHYLLGKLMVRDPARDYFSLGNTWFGLFLVLIFFVAVLRTFISVRQLLTQTPGDLVYERDSSQ
jgi:hypothetical protein